MPGRPGIISMALAVSLTAGAFACPAAAGPWSFGAGGGLIGGYEPIDQHSIDFASPDRFESTWLGSVSVARALGSAVELRAEVSALRYGRLTSGSNRISNYDPEARRFVMFENNRATVIPIALGFRSRRTMGASGLAFYYELMPTLFVLHWTSRVRTYSSFDSLLSDGRAEFGRVAVGLTSGLGFSIRGGETWALDYGVQLRSSAAFRRSSGGGDLTRPEGIRSLDLLIGIRWSPGGPS